MKLFIVLACALAAVSASHVAVVQPYHVPVIGANGVPLEPAENVAARAQHAAAHIEAHARNGDYAIAAPVAVAHHAVAAPIAYAAPVAHYAGPQHLPVIGKNGVPLEPAENVERRAFHANAHVEAAARNGDLYAHHVVAAPVAHAVAAPVVAAYAAPAISTYTTHAVAHHAVAAPVAHAVAVHPAHTFPALAHDGQPLETPEVVAAKSAHFAAHVDAKVRNGDIAYLVRKRRGAVIAAYGVHPAHTYPALAHDGQPLETPEVVAAKSAHFAAHIDARARNAVYPYAAYAAYPYAAYGAYPYAAYGAYGHY